MFLSYGLMKCVPAFLGPSDIVLYKDNEVIFKEFNLSKCQEGSLGSLVGLVTALWHKD